MNEAKPPEIAQAFGLCAIALCLIPIIVLVPIAINPGLYVPNMLISFYAPKFWVFMVLSAPLLMAVMVVMFLDRRRLVVPVLVPALAFLGAAVVSTVFSGSPAYSLLGDRYEGLFALAAEILLFYAAVRFLDSWARVKVFLRVGVATATLISIYGIAQQFFLDPISDLGIPWFSGDRSASTLGGPVYLAAYLTLMMGAALALYFLSERRWVRGIWLVALALIGACWLYTYTRGAILGVGLALPVVLLLAYLRLRSIRPLLLPIAVLVVAMLVAQLATPRATSLANLFGSVNIFSANALYVSGAVLGAGVLAVVLWLAYRRVGSFKPLLLPLAGVAVIALVAFFLSPLAAGFIGGIDEVGTQGSPQQSAEIPQEDREGSVASRFWIWRDTITMTLDRPLLGFGPDNFLYPFDPYQGDDLRAFLAPNRLLVDRAHNELLQIAATTGLLGLAAYLWILVAYFRNAYRRIGWVQLALFGGVLAYILQLQTAFSTIATGVTFWAILGVSVAVMRLQDQDQ